MVKTQVIAGSLHYHATLWSRRLGHWHVCGVCVLTEPEWLKFLGVCETYHVEVIVGETLPTTSA
jgi:hypothetical protein